MREKGRKGGRDGGRKKHTDSLADTPTDTQNETKQRQTRERDGDWYRAKRLRQTLRQQQQRDSAGDKNTEVGGREGRGEEQTYRQE